MALKAAALLREQDKRDEALRILRTFDPAKAAGNWRGALERAVKALEE